MDATTFTLVYIGYVALNYAVLYAIESLSN
jgi:hypothetical protein